MFVKDSVIGNTLKPMKSFLMQLATLFGVGHLKKAPGTWGTLVTLPLVYILSLAGPLVYMPFVLLLLPIGIVASEYYVTHFNKPDAPEVVIDEVVGFLIAMAWLPMTWQSLLIGFLLFRFFDIVKPFPISWVDRKIKGGIGVMADDVLAGIIVNVIMQILFMQTMILGTRIG